MELLFLFQYLKGKCEHLAKKTRHGSGKFSESRSCSWSRDDIIYTEPRHTPGVSLKYARQILTYNPDYNTGQHTAK